MAGIFISYRRSDSAGYAGRLADDLAEHLDGQAIFRDIEAIEPGVDFVHALEKAVASCSVMLVLIGPTWTDARTVDGQRRLHRPTDVVRMEIEAALARDIRVIPVLVGDAHMPDAADLPDSMAALVRRHAYAISDQRWRYDIEQLLAILVRIPGVAALRARLPPPPPVTVAPSVQPTRPPAHAETAPIRHAGRARMIAVVATVAAIGIGIGLVMTRLAGDTGAEGQTATTSEPAQAEDSDADATGIAKSDGSTRHRFMGRWIAADGTHWLIDTSDEGPYVATGSSLAEGTGFSEDTPAPDRAGMELFGNAAIVGTQLSAELVDAYDGEIIIIELALTDDPGVLEGITRTANQTETELALTRH
jgi:hypothetical protein